jgi:hypothetical protein
MNHLPVTLLLPLNYQHNPELFADFQVLDDFPPIIPESKLMSALS